MERNIPPHPTICGLGSEQALLAGPGQSRGRNWFW